MICFDDEYTEGPFIDLKLHSDLLIQMRAPHKEIQFVVRRADKIHLDDCPYEEKCSLLTPENVEEE